MARDEDIALVVADTLGDIAVDLLRLLSDDPAHAKAIAETRDLITALGDWAAERGRHDVQAALHQYSERVHAA